MIMILSVRALMAYASPRFRPELKRIEEFGIGQAKSIFLVQGQSKPYCHQYSGDENDLILDENMPFMLG